MNEETKQKIEEIERKQRELANELEQLRKDAEKPMPWEPKHGDWGLHGDGSVEYGLIDAFRLHGSEFDTEEAAKRASKIYRFYHRLCKLAEELNTSGKIGGKYIVFYDSYYGFRSFSVRDGYTDSCCLFENALSAQKACNIMNRDKQQWTLPF